MKAVDAAKSGGQAHCGMPVLENDNIVASSPLTR